MHEFIVEDESGETLDVIPMCCDSCHSEYAGAEYGGWNGCLETEFTVYCANCGVAIPGIDSCSCQRDNVVVNRFLSEEGETCEHGNWVQIPASYLERMG